MAVSATPDTNVQDLAPEDLALIESQYIRVLSGVVATAEMLRAVEAEKNRLGELAQGTVPIGLKMLDNARREYRATLQRASQVANSLGVVIPVEMMAAAAPVSTSGDVGAVTSETFGGGKKGEERFDRMTKDIMSGGVAPAASVVNLGRTLAQKAIAKLGARKAVNAAGGFARVAASSGKRAAASLARAGKAFVTPAMQAAITSAVAWFAAAAAIRIAGPGIGSGLGNLLSTPGGLIVAGLALYLFVNRR
jgi:hypothetical protein